MEMSQVMDVLDAQKDSLYSFGELAIEKVFKRRRASFRAFKNTERKGSQLRRDLDRTKDVLSKKIVDTELESFFKTIREEEKAKGPLKTRQGSYRICLEIQIPIFISQQSSVSLLIR